MRGGGARRAALGGGRPAAGPAVPDRVPGDPEHPFPRSTPIRGSAGFIGLIGGTAEWVFVKPGHVSVTISAANRMVDQAGGSDRRARLAGRAGRARPGGPMPPWRVVKEKPRHIRRHAGAGAPRPGRAHRPGEPGPGRRLDRDRLARHDRRCHQVGPNRGRGCCSLPENAPCRAKLAATETAPDAALYRGGRAGRRRAGAAAARRRALAVRAGGRRHDPGGIRAAGALPRPHRSGAGSEDRRLSARRSRASMAAGRCSMTARSTCRPA